MNPGLNDPADPKDIDASVVAYLWFNPAFATDDDKDPEIDILTHLKADLPPAIAFFGDKDPWKKGWDTAHAKWKSLGTKTIDLQIATGQSHSFFNSGPWQTVTLIAADQFLVKHGLLTGEPTKTMPASGEKLVPERKDRVLHGLRCERGAPCFTNTGRSTGFVEYTAPSAFSTSTMCQRRGSSPMPMICLPGLTKKLGVSMRKFGVLRTMNKALPWAATVLSP